jgi:hypothetical protein
VQEEAAAAAARQAYQDIWERVSGTSTAAPEEFIWGMLQAASQQ